MAPRSSAKLGNRGESIPNPNIAANIEKNKVNNARFSISLHQRLHYIKILVNPWGISFL
uniref:Uncharacterized protein n=1 Tax=Uncultured archaeon GZfos26G2 TaxID=3386331 RepID=Q649F6_UNCAG|nr:hypothetical protein GZ35B7_4 [uncultured archaeon GZfos35B7]